MEGTLELLIAVVVIGIACQWVAWRLRLPSILLLLTAGVVVGPVTHLVDSDRLLGDRDLEELDLGGVGAFLALTPNDEVNALACVHLAEVLGRSRVCQLVAAERQGERGSPSLGGQRLFGRDATHEALAERFRGGSRVVAVPADREGASEEREEDPSRGGEPFDG